MLLISVTYRKQDTEISPIKTKESSSDFFFLVSLQLDTSEEQVERKSYELIFHHNVDGKDSTRLLPGNFPNC